MNWDKYKFRSSQLGRIMTNPRSGRGLSETCKAYLMEVYISEMYGREKDISNKYLEKGLATEDDGITLYSRVRRRFMRKNKDRFENDFITGTPDLIDGDAVVDIKSSWDIFTFFANTYKPLNKDYAWQIASYADLLGLKGGRLVYCLVNTPLHLIEAEKNKLMWKMGVIDPDAHPLYLEACEKIDKNMTYDDIPIEIRYMEFTINLSDYKMTDAYERIDACRDFLNELG